MVLLVGYAILNAAFFPAGDVLLLFVVVGLVLFLTRNWNDKAILFTAIVFLLHPVEWYHYIANLLNPSHQLPDLQVSEMYATIAEYTKAGNFWDFIMSNITLGQKARLLWAVNAGRFFQTAGLFLLGFYMGRKELFVPSEKSHSFWQNTLVVAAIAFAPQYTQKELVMTNETIVQQSVGATFDMWQKLAFTFVLIASFVLLYRNKKFSNAVGDLRFLWKNELDKLHLPIRHRGLHLLSVRFVSCPSLRIYGEPTDRYFYIPVASEVLQMAAVSAQARSVRVYLA